MTAPTTVSDVLTTAMFVQMSLVFVSSVNQPLHLQPIKLVVVFQPSFWILVQEPVLTLRIVGQLSLILVGIIVPPAPKIVMFAALVLVYVLSAYRRLLWELTRLALVTPTRKSSGTIL
jgi:hypothetical protein